ncbi:MAG: hypothetical protein ACI9WU_004221 [Myxococcota bacterium]|jgi:hypothetical protein
MAFNLEKAAAQRLLGALDDGRLGASDTFDLVKEADPTLVYFVFTWLRASYPPSHPASDAVLGRLGELCSRYPRAAQIAKEGKEDSVVEWFEDAYGYRDFRAAEFIDLVVEKLEG